VLILVAVVLVLGRGFFEPNLILSQRAATESNLRLISEALAEYATLNQRLPCPAAGTADTGLEDDSAGTVNCSSADGVVPWASLSLRRSASLDGWGRKISYRVYSGLYGLTQSGGASMVKCNSFLYGPIDASLGAGNLCKPEVGSPPTGMPPPNTPAQFMGVADRSTMLVVREPSRMLSGNAFVLISHGETGYGAFMAEATSGRTQLPSSTGKETINIAAAGEYWILPRSAPEVAPDTEAHFDDVVAYTTYTDLLAKAKIGARSYFQYSSYSANFDPASVAAAAPGLSGENTGQTSLAMGAFLVTGQSASGASNIGIRTEDGVTGIGAIGGGSTAGDLNSAFGERLTFQLHDDSAFAKMDIALNAMEITDYSPLRKERAEISFWRAGEPLQTSTVESWVAYFASTPSRCLFRLVSGGVFDRVDVAPVSQTGGGGSSRFTVAGIKACTDATSPCTADVPGAVACPISASSATSTAPTSIGTTTATLQGKLEDNGIARGSGSGYRATGAGYSFGAQSISLFSGSGTILAGNCLVIAGDANTYIVATGITAPGSVIIAPPGLRQSIPAFSTPAVSLVHCQTSIAFDYGQSCAVPSSTAATPGSINAGSGSTTVSASIGGLSCGTSYYFRTRTIGTLSATTGNYMAFRTAACAYPVPLVTINTATDLTTTTATLRGFVDDNGSTTTTTFEYGPTSCYGSSVSAMPGTITSGTGMTAVLTTIGDPFHPTTPTPALACNTWYHYRTVAVSATGTTKGDDVAFRTAPCP
jgi:hypothetical protein